MIELNFDIDPKLFELIAMFRSIKRAVHDYRPAWNEMAPGIADGLRTNVDRKGTNIGVTWPPWTAKYAKWRTSKGLTGPMLQLSGALKSSIHKTKITQKKLYVGSNTLAYAGVVTWGRPKLNIPRRTVGLLSFESQEYAVEVMRKHLDLMLVKAAKRVTI